MNFLNNIDWTNHDGVNRGMINDFMRNQFYENIFVGRVQDQHCIDIGFGTGLLSLVAIKHGAKRVIAYESDPSRYQPGCYVIEQLGYKDKIQLLNQKFNHTQFELYPEVTTVFSETVNGNLWQEGLFNSLQRAPGLNFLPREYFLEIYACGVPQVFAQGLLHFRNNQGFSPGIDLNKNFIDLVNQLGFPAHNKQTFPPLDTLTQIDPGQDTEWGWIPYLRLCVNNGQLVGGYSLDANLVAVNYVDGRSKPVDFECATVDFVIDTDKYKDKCVLLVPRVGMRYNHFQLYLDTGHWGPTQSPVILNRAAGHVCVNHHLYSGAINFDLV